MPHTRIYLFLSLSDLKQLKRIFCGIIKMTQLFNFYLTKIQGHASKKGKAIIFMRKIVIDQMMFIFKTFKKGKRMN